MDILVEDARHEDVPQIVAAVHALLGELRGSAPPLLEGAPDACERLVDGRQPGVALVARAPDESGRLIGFLGATWQFAIRAGGEVGVIQELWTDPEGRGQGVGTALLEALRERSTERGISSIEVGLPRPSFPGYAATERFYLRAGFSVIGSRLRIDI